MCVNVRTDKLVLKLNCESTGPGTTKTMWEKDDAEDWAFWMFVMKGYTRARRAVSGQEADPVRPHREPACLFSLCQNSFTTHSHIWHQRNYKQGGNQDEAPALCLAVSPWLRACGRSARPFRSPSTSLSQTLGTHSDS